MVWSGKGAASYDLVLKGKYPPAKLRSLPRIESTGRGRLCRIGATGKVRLTTPPMAPPLAGAFRARISLTHTEWQHFPFLGSRRTAALGVLHRRLRAPCRRLARRTAAIHDAYAKGSFREPQFYGFGEGQLSGSQFP